MNWRAIQFSQDLQTAALHFLSSFHILHVISVPWLQTSYFQTLGMFDSGSLSAFEKRKK